MDTKNIVNALIKKFGCSLNDTGYKGTLILHQACWFGLAEMLITDFGLDSMCMDDKKNTPLHYATRGVHLNIIKILVSQHNADLIK